MTYKITDGTELQNYLVKKDYFVTGNLWGCGYNAYGNLGDLTNIHRSSPVQTIAGGTNWKHVDCGAGHTAAIKIDGSMWCFGYDSYGQLGDNTNVNKSSPVQVIGNTTTWQQVSCGSVHTAAIKTDGTLWTWGKNAITGCLGDSTTVNRWSPVQTTGAGTNWKQVACAGSSTLALKTDGTIWSWGNNSHGTLGDGTQTPRSSPQQISGTTWKFIAAATSNAAAIKTDGSLWCWGLNTYGQIGNNTAGSIATTPTSPITGGTNWKYVSCGNSTAAIKTDGTLWTWGDNTYGQLGDGTLSNKSSPVQTALGGNNWKYVDGEASMRAIKTDCTMWAWGYNQYGSAGNSTTGDLSSPVQVYISGIWRSVACANTHAIAIQEPL